METWDIPLDALGPHPMNSNEMGKDSFAKLVAHIKRSKRYPPLIVRPLDDKYQIIDGHHRARALKQLKHKTARCVVWDVADDETLLLLATLNRLEGVDQPRRRAELLTQLARAMPDLDSLLKLLPEGRAQWESLMRYAGPPPAPQPPTPLDQLPAAVHFFMLPNQRAELETALQTQGGPREEALIQLVRRAANNQ